ncbi:MAG TPA: hypothetical protein VFD72_04910 [Sphingobacteriaceae bacterium]|nr:hypothetical protein [Sphingobacteriaceae bacterium]
MEHTQHIEQLITKFWKGDASEGETKELLVYLASHSHDPEWRQLFEQCFERDCADDHAVRLISSEKSTNMLRQIHESADIPKRIPVRRLWVSTLLSVVGRVVRTI